MNIGEKLIAETLNGKLAFFIGAGIDYNSGVPLVKGQFGIMTKILSILPLNKEEQLKILNKSNLPFESFFEILQKHSNINELLNIFKIGSLNLNHIYLAKLAKLGLLKNILTTNFTQFIELAFEKEGLIRNKDFVVISSDSELENIYKHVDKIKIIKIHGCIEDKNNLVITIQKIANKHSFKPRKNAIEYIFNKSTHQTICVLGYSCSDIFDITPLINKENVKKEIIFINHTFENSIFYDTIQPINKIKKNNAFSDVKFGQWVNYDTDKLIKKMWNNILNINYDKFIKYNNTITENTLVDKYINNWSNSLNMESMYYISGELLNNISLKKESSKYYKYVINNTKNKLHISKASQYLVFLYNSIKPSYVLKYSKLGLSIAEELDNKRLQQIHNKNIGKYYRNIGKYKKAKQYFKTALSINSINDTHIIAKLYMEYGILLKQLKKYKKAKQYFKRAYKEFNNIGSITDKAWSIGNLGNIEYHYYKNYKKAKKHYQYVIKISKDMGLKYNVQVYTGNLGNLYLDIKRYRKALKNLQFALKLSKEIGDKNGEGIWLSNIARYYYIQGNINLACQYIKKSILIAKELKNKIFINDRKKILNIYKINKV